MGTQDTKTGKIRGENPGSPWSPRGSRELPESALYEALRGRRLSVVVPVFNEANVIRSNLDLLVSEIEPYFDSYEVLVVNDGSTDGTRQVLAGYSHPHVRVVTVASNRGKGHGVREGFRLAQGDAVLFIDGGMELHPSAIRVFLGLLELYGADIVIGSKRHPQSRVDYPALRRVLSFIYQKLIKILFRLDVTDTQVGIKLFRRQVVDAILPELRIDRYGFDLELLALARRKGFGKILEAPIRLDYFSRNSRPLPLELLHIVRVGTAILRDTFALYFRLWGTPGRPRGAVVSAPAGPEREDRVQTPEAEEKTG